MSLEESFKTVQEEVTKALVKVRKLHTHYADLQDSPAHLISQPDLDWTINELRTSLRSIEWDLEDLDETLSLLDKSSGSKFKLGASSAAKRKFVADARKEVNDMKEKMGFVRLPTADPDADAGSSRRPLLGAGSPETPTFGATGVDQSDGEFFAQHRARHEAHQEVQLGRIAKSVDSLRDVSQRIAGEVGDQAIMIDELNDDTAVAQSRMDVASQKVAKLLGLSTEKRQWAAIGGLTGFVVLLVILLFAI